MSEAAFTKMICDGLRRLNCLIYPLVGNTRAPTGWPDRCVVHSHWAGFLEFKGVKTPIEPAQQKIAEELWSRQPGSVYFLRAPGILTRPDGKIVLPSCDTGSRLLSALVVDYALIHGLSILNKK